MHNTPLCSTPAQHLPVEFFSLLFASACTWHTRSPVKCYAFNRRHQGACLFPLRQLGNDKDQDDDDNAQQQQLIPTPAETAASRRAGPLWSCLKGKKKKSESINRLCWHCPRESAGVFPNCHRLRVGYTLDNCHTIFPPMRWVTKPTHPFVPIPAPLSNLRTHIGPQINKNLPTPTLQSVPLPDKAFKSGWLRVYAERHPTSFLLLQDELVDDLCER